MSFGGGRRSWVAPLALSILAWASAARADLSFPASFEVVEESPGDFRLTLTVPMIQGRYLKARPVVPEAFLSAGNPEARAGSGTLTRSWRAQVDPASLPGATFGLEGLLGSAQEARFLLTTLDGRRHETVLRATRSLFVVPAPPVLRELSADAARNGLRRAARNAGLWSFFACALLAGASRRLQTGAAVATGAVFIAYWAVFATLPRTGLTDLEGDLVRAFFLAGCAVGAAGVMISVILLRGLLSERALYRALWIGGVGASAWSFYKGAGLVYRNGPLWLSWLRGLWQEIVHGWFAPFSADWAMARLRIPVLTAGVLIILVYALLKLQAVRIRIAVSGILLPLALALLPFGVARASVPFMSPEPPSPRQARRIIEPMLSEIYHALNLADESETYDRLAQQVSKELVADLYLDSRRRLVAGVREGASVTVRRVEVDTISEPRLPGDETPAYPVRWTVTAKVSHWQHTHERRNIYQGELRLAVEDDRWKLAGLNLRSEEREVVPGSFVSR